MIGPDMSSFRQATTRVIVVEAMRCWRQAQASGEAIQPRLSGTLGRYDCAMLSPVLDSLYRFYEAALGRPISIGEASAHSDDEGLLLALIEGGVPRTCINCPNDAATALDCALCSTRIMLALTVAPPARRQ